MSPHVLSSGQASATSSFALVILIGAAALVVAVLASRLSERIRVPAPALFLIATAVVANLVPAFHLAQPEVAEQIVTLALIFILFDGGMHIGWRRFRPVALPTLWIGVVGTAVTAAALAAIAHLVFGMSWPLSLLLGAALSPTDPAVVFSVLGRRDIAGKSGTILEGESGLNDPVGIALLGVLLTTSGSADASSIWGGVGEFALEMVVGGAVGLAGGWLLLQFMQRVSLPNQALYPLRTLGCAALLYGAATLLHGSGYLAVFLAGIVIGDARAPFKAEITRFSSGIGSLAEVVAFIVLGLSVSWQTVFRPEVLLPGIAIAGLLIVVVRPLLVGLVSLPIRMPFGERAFVLIAGLKGAVPILLGLSILQSGLPGAETVFGIVVVVVLISVVVQGGPVPVLARTLRVPMRTLPQEPWAAGMRFSTEPSGVERRTVSRGSRADGATIAELPVGDEVWVSMVRRDGDIVRLQGGTRLRAGDEVLLIAEDDEALDRVFTIPRPGGGHERDESEHVGEAVEP